MSNANANVQAYGPLSTIELYFANTPNGQKATLACEEMGVAYNLHRIDFAKQEQFEPAFLAVNPNNKIPAIVDPTGPGGQPLALFESGAILQYLGNKTGRMYPTAPRERALCEQWLFWQMAGLGPMTGQAFHFVKHASERVPYGIERYTNEVRRLYGVLNGQLAHSEYMAGAYSVADIATYPWAKVHATLDIDFTEFPHIARWLAAVAERPAAKRAALV